QVTWVKQGRMHVWCRNVRVNIRRHVFSGTCRVRVRHKERSRAAALPRKKCKSKMQINRRSAAVVFRVTGGKGFPLLRQVVEREYRRDGTYGHASAAVNTLHGINIEDRKSVV